MDISSNKRVIRLDEETGRKDLFPFTLTRAVSDLRIGIFTLREKWLNYFNIELLPVGENKGFDNSGYPILNFPANLLPIPEWDSDNLEQIAEAVASNSPDYIQLTRPWHLFQNNELAIRKDIGWISKQRSSAAVPSSNKVIREENVFLEPGAYLEHCILNAAEGPVYIGRGAVVMEGSLIRGPAAICEGATVKMGTVIYGGTTIGPYCIAGGEIKNSIIMDFSNKAHYGYLGDSVVGTWCNLGAGTSNSNIKNTGGPVRVWNMGRSIYEEAGQKCGLLMGDYSRSAINVSFNTGTMVGVCTNIFNQSGLTGKFIPSFSWGPGERYDFDKALIAIRTWMEFKNKTLGEADEIRLRHIFDHS